MTKIVYRLLVFCLIGFAGCSQEDLTINPSAKNPGEVTMRFSAFIPEAKIVIPRTDNNMSSMYLLVFDENGNFLVRKQAALSERTDTGGVFTVQLPASPNQRTIHFIVNYDWSNFNDKELVGTNEAGVIAALHTATPTFWASKVLTSGISSTAFDGEVVELLRNQAKISVTNKSANFEFLGFSLYNAPLKGTVAPYDPATSAFKEGVLTEVAGSGFYAAVETDINTNTKYLFERNYQVNPEITGIIVKGKFQGTIYYYKLDLVNSKKVRFNIQRNSFYKIQIRNVLDAGATSFEEAVNGEFHNNFVIDPSMEKYPSISDGLSRLEVESVLVVLTRRNQKFTQQINYYPDVDSPTTDNSKIGIGG